MMSSWFLFVCLWPGGINQINSFPSEVVFGQGVWSQQQHMHEHMCGGGRTAPGVISQGPSVSGLKQGLSLAWGFTRSAKRFSQGAAKDLPVSVSCFPIPGSVSTSRAFRWLWAPGIQTRVLRSQHKRSAESRARLPFSLLGQNPTIETPCEREREDGCWLTAQVSQSTMVGGPYRVAPCMADGAWSSCLWTPWPIRPTMAWTRAGYNYGPSPVTYFLQLGSTS